MLLPGEIDHGQGLADFFRDEFFVRFAVLTQREGHVVTHVHRVEESTVLEKDAHGAPDRGQFALLEHGDVHAFVGDGAGHGFHQADEMTEKNAFAAAAASEKNKCLALVDLQAEAAEDFLPADGLDEAIDRDGLFAVELLAHTKCEKIVEYWKGGSRRPGAIFPSPNRDRDIAIHPTIEV